MRKNGFTLIELMVVVAVIAILAAIAIGAYERYIREARIVKLVNHYDEGIRMVRAEFSKRAAQLSSGAAISVLNDDYVVNNLLNPEQRTAPLGGPAYVSGTGDPDLGAVGVSVTASNNKAGTEAVTFSRPAFLNEVTAETTIVFANAAQ